MYSKNSNKTLFAKGVIGCNTSVASPPFTSHSVDLQEASATQFVIVGRDQANTRVIFIYIDKNTPPGTYNIGRDEKVFAFYYHRYEDFGWSYYADSGTFNLNSVDFDNIQVDGEFHFNAPGMSGEPEMKVTNGVVKLTGPSR